MERPIAQQICAELAAVEGVDPVELDVTLHDHIDVEAIESLAEHDNSAWAFSFELPRHTVSVDSSGDVVVEPASPELQL